MRITLLKNSIPQSRVVPFPLCLHRTMYPTIERFFRWDPLSILLIFHLQRKLRLIFFVLHRMMSCALVFFFSFLHSNNNNNVKNRYNSFRWFEKLDTNDRLKLKQSLLKGWPTTGTSEESVCQLVRKLKSWHGDNDAIMNYEDAIRIPEFRDVEWLNKNGRSRISNAQGFLDDTCLPKHSMLNYL